jgi:ech hydrogenase subunit A
VKKTPADEWIALLPLAGMTVVACALFPLLSKWFLEPYLLSLYGVAVTLNPTDVETMMIMLGIMVLMPLGFFFLPDNTRQVPRYMAGLQIGDGGSFKGSLETRVATLRNNYLGGFLNEAVLMKAGVWSSVALLVLFFLEVKP